MNKEATLSRSSLTIALMVAAITMILSSAGTQTALVASPQGKGGTIKPAPTPATKTTPPKKSTTPAKASRTGASNPVRKTLPAAAKPSAAEIAFWESIKDSKNPEDFREYLKKYPNGEFAGLANNRLKELEAAKAKPSPSPETERRLPSFVPPAPGTTIRNKFGIEMVWVPPGEFMMGLSSWDMGSAYENPDALPVHRVKISNGFYMGEYEITQGQWLAVMGTTIKQQRDKANPSGKLLAEGGGYPMYYISWEDAQEFIRKLNELNDGYTYRLPTEAEWEYACRAGTTTRWSFGDLYAGSTAGYANFDHNGSFPREKNAVWLQDVTLAGSYKPNAFGLYDMHGNVAEWCQDWYNESYYKNSPHSDPQGPDNGQKREVRGGSWEDSWDVTRSAIRRRPLPPSARYNTMGFRIVMVPKL
ncbi:MAG TPA: formylglycine-generating enzyme family protein [Pyrinomonadaceae bacterium]|nr:formylglycine-generating enzyme family protein [Pyrinomonadaceae bacterium]